MASTPWIIKEPDIETLTRAIEQSKKGYGRKRVAKTPPHNSGNCQLETNGQMSHTRDPAAPSKTNGQATPGNSAPVIVDIVDPPGESEPTQVAESHATHSAQDLNGITIDPHLRSMLDAYYCAFRKIGDARAIIPHFDELCDIHRDIWQQLSKSKNKELVDRIRDFRVEYENDMSFLRKIEADAVNLMCNYLKEECLQQWSPYTNGLIDKAHEGSRRFHSQFSDKRQQTIQALNNITNYTKRSLMDNNRIRISVEAKFENVRAAITGQLIGRTYRNVAEERDKQIGDARSLCTYVAIRNRKDMAGLVDNLKKDVLDGLCNDILESYTTKAAPILQHIAMHIGTQRVDALQSIISEQSQRLAPMQMITDLHSEMNATKARLDSFANLSDQDTVEKIQTEVTMLEEQMVQMMRRTKRLRQDQIMLSNARKKARLHNIERKVEQLESIIDKAKQTVLSETFPVRTDQAVTEVYEVLNNHGEFIRRLVDPVAAKNDEQIGKPHLDTISTLHDGLTFPLKFSIEKLAQNAVQDVLGDAMERLDILEKKIV